MGKCRKSSSSRRVGCATMAGACGTQVVDTNSSHNSPEMSDNLEQLKKLTGSDVSHFGRPSLL